MISNIDMLIKRETRRAIKAVLETRLSGDGSDEEKRRQDRQQSSIEKRDLKAHDGDPKSKKAPDNLLKLGITMVQLGEKDQGCKMISGLKKEYPKASKSVLQKAQYEQKKFKCKS